jgi:hypothetical protein
MKKDKRGQFYILSAIIIALVVTSVSSVITHGFVKSEPKSTKELSNALKIESNNVIKYGISNEENIDLIMESFTQKDLIDYFALSPDFETTNITFVYGNRNELKILEYSKENTGEASLGNSGMKIRKPKMEIRKVSPEDLKREHPSRGPNDENDLTVNVSGQNYNFRLEEGQTFYFVIQNYKGGEIFVETLNT